MAQVKRIVEAGGEYVRLTTQGVAEAENLQYINAALRKDGCMVPLVADVHFNPAVADVAALYAEKVRINPGNYVDPARKFEKLEYTDEEYAQELQRLRERFVQFLNICKEQHTAIRIGVNHGSLSDRIMSRYGDPPEGMDFPLHLGVTEAGEGEDGRIKSALGIGALLADGYGDTIRVSLSEAPEAEIPVARKLRDYVVARQLHLPINAEAAPDFDYLHPVRRKTKSIQNIGGEQVPVVIAARFSESHTFNPDFMPDYVYVGRNLSPNRQEGVRYIVDADVWAGEPNTFPVYKKDFLPFISMSSASVKFLFINYSDLNDEVLACLKYHPEVVVISQSNHINRVGEQRAVAHKLMINGLQNPLIFIQHYAEQELEDLQIRAAADMGPLIFDGLCDGIMLYNNGRLADTLVDQTAFSILQAGRLRMVKTEYISCPGCGRTLYNLEETIARIKAATAHLKGLKIGIMGCIVNGPGEMADADYGYVGAGRGKVSLYKQKQCIEKNIPEEQAVERLLQFIESDRAI